MSKYNLAHIREQVRKHMGRAKDPNEFRPPKATPNESHKFRFYILPPYEEGDTLADGPAPQGMDGQFFVMDSAHFINNQRIGCPRELRGEECPLCELGFEMLNEIKEQEKEGVISADQGKTRRSSIFRDLMPSSYRKVNLYFPAARPNPEELHGKVKWFNANKTIFDIWCSCLMADNAGDDPHEPLPFGIFYDEMAAYIFQLEIGSKGQFNDYGKSKFLVTESYGSHPILWTKDGNPAEAAIQKVLAARHNLFKSIPEPDMAALEKHVQQLSENAPIPGGGFTEEKDDETPVGPPPAAKSKPPVAAAKPPAAKPQVDSPKPSVSKTTTATTTTSAKTAQKVATAKQVAAGVVQGPPPAKPPQGKPALKPPVAKKSPPVYEAPDEDNTDDELIGELPADDQETLETDESVSNETVESETESETETESEDEADNELDDLMSQLMSEDD